MITDQIRTIRADDEEQAAEDVFDSQDDDENTVINNNDQRGEHLPGHYGENYQSDS
jgi:hypothetical protein